LKDLQKDLVFLGGGENSVIAYLPRRERWEREIGRY